MKLAALFKEQNVLIHMDCTTLEEAIRMLVRSLSEEIGHLDLEKVCRRILQGEIDLPVAPGHGVRMPHARLLGVDRLTLAMGTIQEGVSVPGKDERVYLIFLILAPKTQSTELLQTMASIARLVHNPEDRKALVSTTTEARALRILEESGIEIKKAIVAVDLMTPIDYNVGPQMTLRQVAETMVTSGEDGVPVLSPEGILLGEISARALIEIGLPKYMDLMTNPKLLSDFQPFETFYKKEDTASAEEIMNHEIVRVAPETPVEIVAHEMLTRHCQRGYVVRDEKLLGVIHRRDFVRKVLCL